jgi:type I restriction enzyme S subunit
MKYQAYEEYKDSGVEWIGGIPSHWKLTRIKFIAECLDGARIPLNAQERGEMQGEIPYWGANKVVDYVNDFLFDEELILVGEDGAPFFDDSKDVAFSNTK